MKDYSLNFKWMAEEFLKETVIINADKECRSRGIYARQYRQQFLADLLLASGHTINWTTGKVTHTRPDKVAPPGKA